MTKLKLKIALIMPYWLFRNFLARRLLKKSKKDPRRYTSQWKWNYVLKRCNKMMKALKTEIRVTGYENLPKGTALLLPNHQSNFDILTLIIALKKQSFESGIQNKQAIFLSKIELQRIKSLKGWLNLTETHFVDRENPRKAIKSLNDFGKFIKKRSKYGVIFPEGTRTKTGQMLPFRSGAFSLAKKEFIPIVPVTINGVKSLENLNRKEPAIIEVIFGKVIKPSSFTSQPNDKLAERVRRIVAKKYKPFTPRSVDKKEYGMFV